jgi:CDP-glycerol glycerophosphotransferase (TagB/SpsB family)
MPIEQLPPPLEASNDPVIASLWRSETFDAQYYLEQYPDVAASGIDPLVHYVRHGYSEGRNPCSHFDSHYYLTTNPDVAKAGINPLLHFCDVGWKELRKPAPDFDVWWYWSTYLEPASDKVNPLAHYVRHGRASGFLPRPVGPFAINDADGHVHLGPVKRICLFAGYDPDNVIDDYVVAYLRALSRHADIYYLADCSMPVSELEKLRGIAKSAWAGRHGTYDFGSYSMLAKSLVGWDRIEQYDELLLVNDSCYLAGDLDAVFNRMDSRRCDWWGLQATKGIAKTRDVASNQFKQPIPLPIVRASMLDAFENDELYDFLIGSYFVAYRKPVINDSGFRKQLDSVAAQPNKQNIIQKYEIGLTRYLITRGMVFDTFIPDLYPFHPIYTNWHFRLIEEGFPLFKRYLLSSNHYQVPHLHRWKEKLQRILPGADTVVMERNLTRVTEPETLEKNLYIGTSRLKDDEGIPSSLLSDAEFLEADHRTPKYDDWWAFPVCAFTGVFSGNERAVYEYVKDDERIRKIVLTRNKSVSLTGQNLIVVPLESPEGQYYMLRAKVMFIKHTPTRNLIYPLASELHHLINLWHGIPLKRIGYASLDQQARSHAIAQEHSRCKAVISSSHVDTLAMAAAFYPLSYNDVWPTGLPRNDFIVRAFHKLPVDLQRETDGLLEAMQGRKLVLFMPTFRNGQDNACFRFSEAQLQVLEEWLKENNAVMGVREHMADSSASYARQFQNLQTLLLTADEYPNPEVLYREASLLITDYSSCFIDFMLTDKPMISFAYDLEHYETVERGLFYDLEHVFPGPVCRNFSDLQAALTASFKRCEPLAVASYQWKKRTFFDHYDDCNSARLVKRIEQLLN